MARRSLQITALILITAACLITTSDERSAEVSPVSDTPPRVSAGDRVQEHYHAYATRLESYFESLSAVLSANAPDLLPRLNSPRPPGYGYQILPKITGDLATVEQHPRSSWYSWPWTNSLIQRELREIARSEAELNRAASSSSIVKKSVYEKLANVHRQLRAAQNTIDAHIQYNRLWQSAVANDRPGYDRETLLHDIVVERQTILDLLQVHDELGFKKAAGGFTRLNASPTLAERRRDLIEREKTLARAIHESIQPIITPRFVHVEQRGPNLWIIHVPFYTDIDNHDFVAALKTSIEAVWRLRDGADTFHVELSISFIPAEQLYPMRQIPEMGKPLNLDEHLALFPAGSAILTTGAVVTHVYGRAILLAPHDITPRVLAHEFGHILGFRDNYVRGYKDLGKEGFQVMEIVADPNDIMGAPATGAILRSHFERILAQSANGRCATE